ncbi:hypothetical protein ANN_26296 [Periplaneta americana]|uniref:DDE-1 domain-containing protein n=1 Tax=Periplaneta americana TaxID=6978 RepID=A0ABQ8S5V4_PERAM|nr:hypothetical protein ANN_26296 [Periplaneta americana]
MELLFRHTWCTNQLIYMTPGGRRTKGSSIFYTKPCCSRGTRYNRTSHGWFDTITFTDWFKSMFLPHASRLPGKKALIGDNLSSHFNEEVLQLCEKNNIFLYVFQPTLLIYANL